MSSTTNFLQASVANSMFANNSALDQGGGLMIVGTGDVTVTGCNFSDNTAPNAAGLSIGGASSVKLDQCVISGNLAANYGGGLRASDTTQVNALIV